MITQKYVNDATKCCRCENKSFEGCLGCRNGSNFKAECTYDEYKQKRKEERMSVKLNDLDRLIPQYALNKQEADSYKKLCDKENALIKEIMKKFVVADYTTADYKASYNVSERTSMNEEMLLEIAHNYGLSDIIKTKEYIDFDALEKAIYDGKISNEILLEMDKAKEVKEVVTLRVTKRKDKE